MAHSASPIYACFSGGGWNSHSFLAGMLSGSLDAQEKEGKGRSLSKLLQNLEGISANSGGTWFLTQLAFSEPFRKQFESLSETNHYKTTGYGGQTRKLFESAPKTNPSALNSPRLRGLLQSAGVSVKENSPIRNAVQSLDYHLNLMSAIGASGLNWYNLVEGLVYKPFNMNSSLNTLGLNGERQNWAKDKDLLYGTAFFNAPVVMENNGPDTVLSSIKNAGVNVNSQFTPVTISSEVTTPGSKPVCKVVLGGGNANLEISNSNQTAAKTTAKPLASTLNANELNAMAPSVASSAAGAMMASPNSWAQTYLPSDKRGGLRDYLSEFAKGLAPIAQLNKGALKMPRSLPANKNLSDSINQLSDGMYSRFADGGYVDNISAANMLRHIQDTDGTSKPFTLTLFSNTSTDPVTGIRMKTGPNQDSSFTLPSDVSGLFGNSDGRNQDQDLIIFPDGGFNIKVPSNKIFDPSAWNNKTPAWSTTNGDVDISYFKLNVNTVENKAFGIKAGQSGTVNLFVARNKNSGPGPFKSQYLDSYDNNFDVYRTAISSGGAYPFIKEAFGLAT